ncbi:MAG: DUF885 domain-containing protein [Polyangiales bacterium]
MSTNTSNASSSPQASVDPFLLSDEVVDAIAKLCPMTASLWGVRGTNVAWDDLSPEGQARLRETMAEFLARVPPEGSETDPWRRLASQVLTDFLQLTIDRVDQNDHLTDLNFIASPFQFIRMVFDVMDATTEEGWRAQLARLETIDRVFEGYRRLLARGVETANVVAARQVRAVIEQGRYQAGDKSFFRTLPGAMAAAGIGDAALRARLDHAVDLACSSHGAFVRWLEESYLPHARATDAVGRIRYVREARRFLGMTIDPDETYAWGWQEIEAIGTRMQSLANEISPGATVAEVLTLLKTTPEHAAPSIDAFLALMRQRQHQALAQLTDTHFDVPVPARLLDVKLAPPGGPLGAYYIPPSEGFARIGCVWYSVGDATTAPLFDEVTTAYHEGFPGHHLQFGIQVALTDRLSRLQRVAEGYAGFAEGWALYAEALMAELGYFEKPEYLFGMLTAQMTRACRVVIDIGAHLSLPIALGQTFHPGEAWSYDLGVEMLSTLGGLGLEQARSEMTRYLGWPGQAIAYKVGQRVILGLRDEVRAACGSAYDAKAFHSCILEGGNVSLERLVQRVRAELEDPHGRLRRGAVGLTPDRAAD